MESTSDPENEIHGTDDFDELFNGQSPMTVARMVEYGYFNSRDEYFTFDRYGSIVTISYKDVGEYLKDQLDDDVIIEIAEEYKEDEEDD